MDRRLHQQYLAEINHFYTLKDGWASEGDFTEDQSFAPTPDHIRSALILFSLWPENLPLITPTITCEGIIGFFLDTVEYYIEIEIEDNNTFSCEMYHTITRQDKYFVGVSIDNNLPEFFNYNIYDLKHS